MTAKWRLDVWWDPESVSAFTIRRFWLVCKHIVYTTIVNFHMNIVYRRKIKNWKKKTFDSSDILILNWVKSSLKKI